MKKTLAAAILIPLFLFSCASIPEPSEKSQSILVIHQQLVGEHNIAPFVSYQLVFDDNGRKRISIPAGESIIVSDALEPGRHTLTSVLHVLLDGRPTGEYEMSDNDIIVELNEGGITIFPYTFEVSITKRASGYRQSWRLASLGSSQVQSITEELLSYPNIRLWEPYKSGDY